MVRAASRSRRRVGVAPLLERLWLERLWLERLWLERRSRLVRVVRLVEAVTAGRAYSTSQADRVTL